MTGLQQQEHNNGSIPPFRLDVQLHELLNKPPERPTLMSVPSAQPLTLPEPVFPQRPELLTDEELKIDKLPRAGVDGRRAAAATAIRAQDSLLRREKGVLGVSTHQRATASHGGNR